jgi:hypothetical protein
MQGLLNLKAQQSTTQAQLEAAAAGADTRSGKEKANAELDLYRRKSKIDLDNTLKTIAAQARGRGASASEIKTMQEVADVAAGETSGFGRLAQQRLNNLERVFRGEIAPPAGFKLDKKTNSLYRTSDKAGVRTPVWKLEYGILAFNNGTTLNPDWIEVPTSKVLYQITRQVGALQSLPKDKQLKQFTNYFNQAPELQSSITRQALTIILGPGASKPDFYINAATTPFITAAPPTPYSPTKQQTPKLPAYDLSKGFGSGTSSSKTTPKTSKGSTSTGYGGPTPPKSKKGSTTNTGYTGYTGPRR